MPGYLTTHVLDTARGCPAAGLAITLTRIDGAARSERAHVMTNADGRTDGPILPETDFATGTYELVFEAENYLLATGQPTGFLGDIPIRFSMTDDDHYHVPLLLSPFGYSTYRGS
ncbi:MAG: hydroxyisourate hydrolase [Pseudomonadota bacterium]